MFKQVIKWLLLLCSVVLTNTAWAAVKEYHLVIDEKIINITGKSVKKITVNGQFPAPLLTFEEGDDAVIVVKNQLKNQDSSIHWHGLLLPGLMDGVPGFNQFQGIAPQREFTYRFKVRQNGTYWYHAHSKGQEQDGLYGALIIYPKGKMPLAEHESTQRDYVVMLSDFHTSNSQVIMNNLKKDAEFYQNRRETLPDVWQQMQRDGLKATWQDRKMWNQMRMLKTDLSDVTGYTFLINGKTAEQNWTAEFNVGEKVRLRFINASAMSFFDVRIPNLNMTVVSADGKAVKPVNIDEFRIGTAETYDVIVEPRQAQYQIQAESIDRSGFAIGQLLQQGIISTKIPMPEHRPRALLTMQDMPMQHANHENVQQSEHDQMDHSHHMMQHDEISNSQQPIQGWADAATPIAHKALQYSDLKALQPQLDLRQPESEIVIRLGGSMERYIWTINGKKFNEATPIQVKYGDRIRLKFINDSMMAHPMHLHGMFVQLENGANLTELPNKHTLIVPPNQTVTALLTADELGEWAIHCHLLYHMTAGMMNKLIVADVATPLNLKEQQGEHHAHH